jgi:hypothetical protein
MFICSYRIAEMYSKMNRGVDYILGALDRYCIIQDLGTDMYLQLV